jgi:hypothetical protein
MGERRFSAAAVADQPCVAVICRLEDDIIGAGTKGFESRLVFEKE